MPHKGDRILIAPLRTRYAKSPDAPKFTLEIGQIQLAQVSSVAGNYAVVTMALTAKADCPVQLEMASLRALASGLYAESDGVELQVFDSTDSTVSYSDESVIIQMGEVLYVNVPLLEFRLSREAMQRSREGGELVAKLRPECALGMPSVVVTGRLQIERNP